MEDILDAAAFAGCSQANYFLSETAQREEFERHRPYYVDVAKAVLAAAGYTGASD